MKPLRLAIAGLGNMGATHARHVLAGRVPRLELTAVIDADASRCAAFPGVAAFTKVEDAIAAQAADALLVATPHFSHPALGQAAIRAGWHVLIEKPLAVHVADAEPLLAEPRRPGQIVGAVLNQRTNPGFQKIRDLIRRGEFGQVQRVQWTITDWFRPAAYYRSATWRATWAGEGGGVLLNQAPHQLDLLWWLFGRPRRVRAFCRFGLYHAIEVEDEVTAYLEFHDGSSAVFITSTGEAPGTNRLEIAGDRGRAVFENGSLSFRRNEVPTTEFSRTTTAPFSAPPTWDVTIPLPAGAGGQHVEILQNFTAAVLDGAPLLAPADEAIHSVELANAMLLSTWLDRTIELPLDGTLYARELERRIAGSRRP